MEYRSLVLPVELREAEGKVTFVGTAVRYGSRSELIYGAFREVIARGAFDDCLKREPDVIATIDHDQRRLLGRTSSGSLRLEPGKEGIDVAVSSPDTTYARDLAASVRRRDIRGMSFIFEVIDDRWSRRDGVPHREVKKADIYEVSFVVTPAYPDTDASMRSAVRGLSVRELERMCSELDGLARRRQELAERHV